MAAGIYLASTGADAGKSVVTLGILDLVSSRVQRIGYFRPVVDHSEERDARLRLVRGRYGLAGGDLPVSAFSSDEVADLLGAGRSDEVMTRIVERYRAVAAAYDFVLVDGTDYTGVAAALEFEFNAEVATHLGTPVVTVVNGHGRRADDVGDAVRVARGSLLAAGCSIAATVVNRVDADRLDDVHRAIRSTVDPDAPTEPLYVLPEEPLLGMPTVDEIAGALDAVDLRAGSGDRGREVATYKVAAMRLEHVLEHLVEGALVITPGDRADVILGSFASRLATTYPNIAGLLLTGGLDPDPLVLELLDGLSDVALPVLAVDEDTFVAADRVSRVAAVIGPDDDRRIATALGVFERHVDRPALAEAIELARSDRVTPLMFEYELMERARRADRHIVLPEGTDDRVLQAAQLLRRRGVVRLTVLGDEQAVRSRASALGLDLDDVDVVDPATSELRDGFAARYHELRRHKGVTEDQAADVMQDVSYFGTMLVHEGHVDGMVSGAAHTTAHTIRPALEFIKTREGVGIVSSVFLMLLADRVLVYGDCAINPNPDAEQLADIATSSAETAERFGVEPRVAMLSYSTGASGSGEDVERVRRATELARERRPDLPIDGPLQYDAAVDASVGAAKMPGSEVAGQATVFIFPDLNTGNNTYKAVQRSAGAVAVGPVLQGLNRPVNDLSRGCLVADIVNTVAITAVQAAD